MTFNEEYWQQVIKKPDWYLEFIPYVKDVHKHLKTGTNEYNDFNYSVRSFFESALMKNQVALAKSGPNLDEQRLPIDTLVIHHTSNNPGYRLSYLNAVHLLNIYAPNFFNPTDKEERSLKGQGIWSGHFKNGQQVFWGYHWLMRMDGSFERLLKDKELGWHAGNWEINRRSVAICLDNDYENKNPTDDVLQKLAAHIKKHYPKIKRQNIIGHCEARDGTICPGKYFLKLWKPLLLEHLND